MTMILTSLSFAVVALSASALHAAAAEPLKVECRHFLDCIEQHRRPRSSAEDGLNVVRALEAASASLRDSGRLVDIAYPALKP